MEFCQLDHGGARRHNRRDTATASHTHESKRPFIKCGVTMEALVQRVRGEFREMPGLRLTFGQACRLWQMDPTTCRLVLERLIRDGVLLQTRNGHYVASPRPSSLHVVFDRPKRAAS